MESTGVRLTWLDCNIQPLDRIGVDEAKKYDHIND